MDLIPVYPDAGDGDEELGSRQIRMSAAAQRLAEVETTPVARRFVEARVRMVGKIEYDETRLANITAWVGGRLDRLFVDYTGVSVKKGDHLVRLYSPELLSAQEELLQAARAVRELAASNVESVKRSADATVVASREKLRLWGLTAEQIDDIEKSQKPSDHVTIYAPAGGIVVHKNAVEGMYVTTGSRIYTIADLSQVWVKLDAYESDLQWVRYGQKVAFETEAYPGDSFEGRIAFIDPVLDSRTRTTKVRVNVPNIKGRLKPGMFVRAVLSAGVSEDGSVVAPDLAGKWICPMHPEVVRESPDACDICGMPLVSAASLGYVSETRAEPPLVIPVTAVLITGERAVVYVAVPDSKGVFEGREVVLGPRAGEYYVIRDGLREGERVVTKGNFKIDSALQILAKKSMMSPEGGAPAPGHQHQAPSAAGPSADAGHGTKPETPSRSSRANVPAEFVHQVSTVLGAYFQVRSALSADDLEAAHRGATATSLALSQVDMSLLSGTAHESWMKEARLIARAADAMSATHDLTKAREAFHVLSESLTAVAAEFGGDVEIFQAFCPMAFGGRGAHWLSADRQIGNPYFGSAMLRCGEIVKTIPAAKAPSDPEGSAQ
jgi:Cu(I)/Ag(I) efflux system membrane fusion protein